mgnify:CR=1 FL=1
MYSIQEDVKASIIPNTVLSGYGGPSLQKAIRIASGLMVPPQDNLQDDTRKGDPWTAYSRRELLGLVITLWLAGSISKDEALRLLYGFQGYGYYKYGD